MVKCDLSILISISGIKSPLTTFLFRFPPWSVILFNKSKVFCPCSAKIEPPAVGIELKSYSVLPKLFIEPYPERLCISALTRSFNAFISSAVII